MSDTPSNPATGNGTRQQPGNVVCRHCPMEPVAAFVHVCKRCGVPIEARSCMACDGTGRNMDPLSEGLWCKECDRSGIDRWEAVP